MTNRPTSAFSQNTVVCNRTGCELAGASNSKAKPIRRTNDFANSNCRIADNGIDSVYDASTKEFVRKDQVGADSDSLFRFQCCLKWQYEYFEKFQQNRTNRLAIRRRWLLVECACSCGCPHACMWPGPVIDLLSLTLVWFHFVPRRKPSTKDIHIQYHHGLCLAQNKHNIRIYVLIVVASFGFDCSEETQYTKLLKLNCCISCDVWLTFVDVEWHTLRNFRLF